MISDITVSTSRFGTDSEPFTVNRAFEKCSKCGRSHTNRLSRDSQICGYCLFGLVLEPDAPDQADVPMEYPLSGKIAIRVGNYALCEEIGRGGMGVIHRAVHRETNAVVALKTVLPEDANCLDVLVRFQREAVAAQSLDHPHSMPIFEVGCSDEGVPFFTMPLAEGGSLYDLRAKYAGRWRQIAELLVKISEAVHHAHTRGILHRDLKPGNILFTADHEPLVSDFGLVKLLAGSQALTHSHTVLGTPNYVAPEQAAGRTRELTAAADIYSLGAMLYEMLTGQPPFVGNNALEVLQQVIGKTPTNARRLAPSIPKALDTICMRCLERRPEDRYTSARDLAADLRCWLRGREIKSRPVHARLQSRIRRHPLIYGWIAGLFGIALVCVIIWTLSTGSHLNSENMVSIAVAVENLGETPSLGEIARSVTVGLREELARARMFRVLDAAPFSQRSSTEIFDSLKAAQLAKAEVLLASTLCCSADQVRIISRLVRCDTGEVIWRNTSAIPAEHATLEIAIFTKAIVGSLEKSWHAHEKPLVPPSKVPSDAQAFYDKAMELAVRKNSRDLEAAITLFRLACELDPHFARARAMLALSWLTKANQYGDITVLPMAISTAKEALDQDPDSGQAHRVIAECYFTEGRYQEALSEYWRGVELDPESPGCAHALGVCLRELGHPDQAVPWLTRAVRLAPSRGAFSTALGETFILCGLDEKAELALKRAAELDPDRPDAQIALSVLRTWQKQFEEARRLCAGVCERFPRCKYGSTLAAWIEFCDGNAKDAKSKFENLRAENTYQQNWEFFGAVNPSSALAYLAIRDGSIERGHLLAQEALRIDRDLLDKYPRNPRILHDLAATFAVIGDCEKTHLYLNQAVEAGWVEHRSTQMDPRFSPFAENVEFPDIPTGSFSSTAMTTKSGIEQGK